MATLLPNATTDVIFCDRISMQLWLRRRPFGQLIYLLQKTTYLLPSVHYSFNVSACAPKTFGQSCSQCGHCLWGVQCDKVSGQCPGNCESGWTGTMCTTRKSYLITITVLCATKHPNMILLSVVWKNRLLLKNSDSECHLSHIHQTEKTRTRFHNRSSIPFFNFSVSVQHVWSVLYELWSVCCRCIM